MVLLLARTNATAASVRRLRIHAAAPILQFRMLGTTHTHWQAAAPSAVTNQRRSGADTGNRAAPSTPVHNARHAMANSYYFIYRLVHKY
jgi:hypothetical protein